MSQKPSVQQFQQEPVTLERLLTVKDIADLLQLSQVKVYRMISDHGLPSIKIGGSRRFRPSEVYAWIEQHGKVS